MIPPLILEGVANVTRTASAFTAVNLAPATPAVANSTAVVGIVPWIQGFASSFAANASVVTLTMDDAAISIGKAAVVFLVIAGVFWFTRINKHLGKELVQGGIIIGIFIEFIVPILMSIHY